VQIPGGVTAAKGYRASGMYAAVRAGKKRDLALVVSETDAVSAGEPGRPAHGAKSPEGMVYEECSLPCPVQNSGSLQDASQCCGAYEVQGDSRLSLHIHTSDLTVKSLDGSIKRP
jgi:hypothetical protein